MPAMLPASCWEDFLMEVQPPSLLPSTTGGSSANNISLIKHDELSARVDPALYGANKVAFNNIDMNPFSPLAGLFLAYVRGGERATIVISKRPQCARAVNATLAIMVGHVTINVSTYGRSADGFRVTVRLPSYDAVMDGVGGGKETKNITVKAIATYTRGEGTVETPLLSWSCPPSCPGESGRNEPSEGDTRKRIGWKNTNQSFLHPGNTAALRKAVGGVTYVRRCTSNKGNTSAASSQSSSSSPPPEKSAAGDTAAGGVAAAETAVSTSTTSTISRCAQAVEGLLPFATDPRLCLDPAKARSAPCALGDGDNCRCCPLNARCPGGARMWPKRGYYAKNERSTFAEQCKEPQMERCLGMVHGNSGNMCGVGYRGTK